MPECASLLRVRIFHQAINLAPFMIVWQMLCNREAFGVHKQQTMAVFVDLHLVTGTDPATQLGFRSLVRIKITGTERLAHFFDVSRQPLHHHIRHAVVRMQIGPGLFGKLLRIGTHFAKVFLTGLVHGVLSSLNLSVIHCARGQSTAWRPLTSCVLRAVVMRCGLTARRLPATLAPNAAAHATSLQHASWHERIPMSTLTLAYAV